METLALRTLWTECFGNEGGWIDSFFGTAFDHAHVCGLTRQGQLAAALCWMDVSCEGRKLAYLYAIATAPEFRHQGLCRELMGLAHEKLAGQGYSGTILVPADDGLRQMYGKMGYANFGGIRELSVQAEGSVPIRQISPSEYSALRRGYLPMGGVVQEDGAVEYLAAGAELYAGMDFLLAAEGGFGMELLGNSDAAPGIVSALGLDEGTFRIPGDKPFAMYHSLTGENWMPGYFGLAFE
ncbi:MAG: GNAT family N-acetyltransferase [Eubacteriales bacterium]|nr:GNAT family N-acetyltransferase [Eubacteriales bacterium]